MARSSDRIRTLRPAELRRLVRHLQTRAQGPVSRRRAVQGLGALMGATALGACGDSESGTETEDGTVTSEGSTGTTAGTGTETGTETGTGTTGPEPFDVCDESEGTPEELLAGIDHIIVLMMENRSFDHYYGSMQLIEGLPVLGLDGTESNAAMGGESFGVFNLDHWVSEEDPPHGWDSSHHQWNNGANDGFVTAFEEEGATGLSEVMGYYTRAQLPILHALADEYVLCDAWYSSVMGPTWPNRNYVHLATSNGIKTNDSVLGFPSIYDRCADAGVSAKYYYSGLPFALSYGTPLDAPHMAEIDEFFVDAAAGQLPQFSMIEPLFTALQVVGNDDHPPADIRDGQALIASVYQALADSPNWERTLLIITYDEHGGFYDHVAPPTTFEPIPEFDQLGFRVPSVVVGPQVRRGCATSLQYDHVSALTTATIRFGLEPLNERLVQTNDVSNCIDPALINNPRPPIVLPEVRVCRDRRVLVPGANFGGQVELARLYEQGQKYGRRGWQHASVRAWEAIRHHSLRLKTITLVDR